jgi:hypothetical protein
MRDSDRSLWAPTVSPRHGHREDGLTVLEAILAAVVMVLVMTAVSQGIVAGDRARGKRLTVSRALLLAQSEAERVKYIAACSDTINDTLYSVVFGAASFEVVRQSVEKPDTARILPQGTVRVQEVVITARRLADPRPNVTLRLMQGFTGVGGIAATRE